MDTELIGMLKKASDEIRRTVIGKDDIIIKILMTICAGGHVLLEDIPGVGKTTIAVAFSRRSVLNTTGCSSHRTYCLPM